MQWLKYDTGEQQAKKYFSKETIFTIPEEGMRWRKVRAEES